jgi:hypothetical protein
MMRGEANLVVVSREDLGGKIQHFIGEKGCILLTLSSQHASSCSRLAVGREHGTDLF